MNVIWKMHCKHGCGWNVFHTSGLHKSAMKVQDGQMYKVPSTHSFWVISGQSSPKAGGSPGSTGGGTEAGNEGGSRTGALAGIKSELSSITEEAQLDWEDENMSAILKET